MIGFRKLVGIASGFGERIELVDIRRSPVQEVDWLIAKLSLDAVIPDGAAGGVEVAAQESSAIPGAGLTLELGDEFGVGLAVFFAVLFTALFFLIQASLAFAFESFRFEVYGKLPEAQ